ncbi:Heparinase II/III-like protein [compost metagenome]
MLNVAGEWLLTSPGYQDYVPGPRADYTTGTIGHNSLLVNSQGQVNYGGGQLVETWMTHDCEVVQGDASKSYGDLLESYSRSILHLGSSYFIVWDEVITNEEMDRIELLFHTQSSIYEDSLELKPGDTVRGDEVTIQGEKAALQLKCLFPKETEIQVTEYPGAESYGPYLIVAASPSGRQKSIVTLMKPMIIDELVQVMDCSELSEAGSLGLKLQRDDQTKDIILLHGFNEETTATVVLYEGCLLQGRAAWINYRLVEKDRYEIVRIVAWQMTELNMGDFVAISSDLPVNVSVMGSESEWVICNGNSCEVSISIKTIGLEEKQWTLPPGEYKLAWPFEGKEG